MKQAKDFNTCIKNMVRSIGRTKDLGGRALKSLDGERSSGKSRGDDVGGWGRERQRNTHTHTCKHTQKKDIERYLQQREVETLTERKKTLGDREIVREKGDRDPHRKTCYTVMENKRWQYHRD
jgi:hypothetical protein